MINPWLAWVLGILVGIVLTVVAITIKSAFGTLLIDRSNPDKEIQRLVVADLENVHKKKYICLKVNAHANLSQK